MIALGFLGCSVASARSVMEINCKPPKLSPPCRADIIEKIKTAQTEWGRFDFVCADGIAWRIYPAPDSKIENASRQFILANLSLFGVENSTPSFNGSMQTFENLFIEDRGAILWSGEDMNGRKTCSVLSVKLEDIPPLKLSKRPRLSESTAISIAKKVARWDVPNENTTAHARLGIIPRTEGHPAMLYWGVSLQKTDNFKLQRPICIDANSGLECSLRYSEALNQPL